MPSNAARQWRKLIISLQPTLSPRLWQTFPLAPPAAAGPHGRSRSGPRSTRRCRCRDGIRCSARPRAAGAGRPGSGRSGRGCRSGRTAGSGSCRYACRSGRRRRAGTRRQRARERRLGRLVVAGRERRRRGRSRRPAAMVPGGLRGGPLVRGAASAPRVALRFVEVIRRRRAALAARRVALVEEVRGAGRLARRTKLPNAMRVRGSAYRSAAPRGRHVQSRRENALRMQLAFRKTVSRERQNRFPPTTGRSHVTELWLAERHRYRTSAQR